MFDNIKYGDIEEIDNAGDYKEFLTPDEAELWGNEIYKEWGNEIKKFEIIKRGSGMFEDLSWAYVPLERYSGWDYRQINNFLRNNNEDTLDAYKYTAVRLSEMLLQAPRIKENIVVYRYVGSDFIEELLQANKKFEHHYYYEKGFTSTSLLKKIVDDAPDDASLLKLYVDKGTVGAYVDTVVSRAEHEILLQNNLFIRLCKAPYFDKKINRMIFECKTHSFCRR